MNGNSRTLLSEKQIAAHLRIADGLVANAEWAPRAQAPAPGKLHQARLAGMTQSPTQSASLVESLKGVRKDESQILGEKEHLVLFSVRRGIQIGLAAGEEYKRLSGIDRIGNVSTLSNEKRTELQEKMRTAAAIVLFTMARFAQQHMGGKSDEGGQGEHITLPELVLDDPIAALRCAVFYLCANAAHPKVNNDKALIATASLYLEKILEDIEGRKSTFKHLEQFQAIPYGLEDSDFTVEGLERHDTGVVSVEFNRVEMGDIVGNADAKHFARRLARRICCYNFKEHKNVFQELGGLMPVWMGSGKPGTGKSMLIAATATMLDDLCRQLNVPFLFHPLPDNLIDSYQGNSAKNMVAWMKPTQAPDKIVFAAIDDGENTLEERTRQGVSEGVRAVIGVFLRYTEGAYAIKRGNSTIGIFTNLPEQIDGAVRSRIQGRMVIDGAETVEDALDQNQLWWKRFSSQPGFVDLRDPDWYQYQAAQGKLATLADAKQTHDIPQHAAMRELFEQVAKAHALDSHEFFAQLFVAVEKRYPAFSSRDLRNIQSAIDLRIMDFDIPDQWFEAPETFHAQPYDRQKDMVLELRNAAMKGLKFGDVMRQEYVRYLDNYAVIADAQFDREVEARIKEMRVRMEVERRMKGGA